MDEMRLDELAHRSGVATTTVRLYQNRGLLPGPRLVGRTGWYDGSHLARLELIGRLQEEGFSLAGIARLLDAWESGGGLEDLLGSEAPLEALMSVRREVVLDPAELAKKLPVEALTPEAMQRAVSLGLVELTDDGRIRVPDDRFLSVGAELTALGVPVAAVLDEWEHLAGLTDEIAGRFIDLFESRFLPEGWENGVDEAQLGELAATLARLRGIAAKIVDAALDASLLAKGSERLGGLGANMGS